MRIHPREERTRKAEYALKGAVHDIIVRHDLTEAEGLRVVNAALSDRVGGVAKYAIREERHGNTDTPGGFEPECPKGGAHEWMHEAKKPIRCTRCKKLRASL